MWPGFFIVGAPKAGTTSLYFYLKQIPGIFMSKVKEPGYFLTKEEYVAKIGARVIKTETEYLKLFKGAELGMAKGEASPFYLWDEGSPKKIYSLIPNARIIILLRDPIQRAFSYYLMMLREGYESQSFHDAVTRDYSYDLENSPKSLLYLQAGYYYSQVKRYVETFGWDNVRIIMFEDFVKDIRGYVTSILDFLNVNSRIPADFDETPRNSHSFSVGRPGAKFVLRTITSNRILYKVAQSAPSSVKKVLFDKLLTKRGNKPHITEETRQFLKHTYDEDIRDLELFLNRKVPWGKI